MTCKYTCSPWQECTCKPLPIQMSEDIAMDAPWWELAVIVVALAAAFVLGIFVGRWLG
jgi:hypothetical protein